MRIVYAILFALVAMVGCSEISAVVHPKPPSIDKAFINADVAGATCYAFYAPLRDNVRQLSQTNSPTNDRAKPTAASDVAQVSTTANTTSQSGGSAVANDSPVVQAAADYQHDAADHRPTLTSAPLPARNPRCLVFMAPFECAPCRSLNAAINELERSGYTFGEGDGHHFQLIVSDDAAAQWNVRSYPTLIVIDGTRQVARHSGSMRAADLKRWFDRYTFKAPPQPSWQPATGGRGWLRRR